MDNPDKAAQAATRAEREAFYARIGADNLAPLWEQLHNLVTPTPRSDCQPAHWSYQKVRPYLTEATGLITAEEAERRVLILENPGLRGKAAITTSLYAGLQAILPGEVARAHRHSQSALRLILEGDGAYTSVNGEKTIMRRGDFVTTPSWTWHDHGNDSDAPMIWLDGLDVQLVGMLDASFAQSSQADRQELLRPVGDSQMRYGNGLAPMDWQPPANKASPLFSYPYERTRASLHAMQSAGEADPCHGYKLRYIDPLTGGPPMPTMGAYAQLLPAGFDPLPYRCSSGTVFAVLEGRVLVELADRRFLAEPNDVFVIPSWAEHRLVPQEKSVLFSFSDRPVQEALGLWREQRGGASGSL
ncbi:Gentisate 1,2-dioxygenase [Pigmentiphaga humi]|uniref:Gentisate 1,2-dioxygenase n=1 Tax=Pigmentiphaga humi TaxID=2478468 RepID=A0A3P4B2E4_9BURK|nr:gentisate 1,2-dioxygenase [Pigmentiphaga humi]VCU70232.1 Gentisate 1,2-dioxygenase [Pigmentiphaga humi]